MCSERFTNFSSEDHLWYPVLTCVCKNCGHVFMSPRMTIEELTDFYSHQMRESFTIPRGESIGLFKDDMDFITNTVGVGHNRYALEIGSYTGYMLKRLSDSGWIPEGLEPNSQSARRSRELFSYKVYEEMIETFCNDAPHKYDLVVMGSILEHVNNPVVVLDAISRIIPKGGFLFLRFPDVEELALDTIADVFPLEHPHMYSSEILRRIYMQTRFEEILNTKHKNFKRHIISIAKRVDQKSMSERFINMYDHMVTLIKEYNQRNYALRLEVTEKTETLRKSGKRVAVYGAGNHTEFLFRYTTIEKCRVTGIVDSNSKKHGKKQMGYTIHSSDWISPETCDAVIISSRAFQEEIYNQISYLLEKGISIVRLYDLNKSKYQYG